MRTHSDSRIRRVLLRTAFTLCETVLLITIPGWAVSRGHPPTAIILLSFLWILWNLTERLSLTTKILFKSTVDHSTLFIYMAAMYISQVSGVVECSQRQARLSALTAGIGILLFAFGVFLRMSAIHRLRDRFTYSLSMHHETPLTIKGVYAYIRHPAYAGDVLILAAGAELTSSFWQGVTILFIFVPALALRIHHEENALVMEFGDSYRKYQANVNRFVPRLALCKSHRS